MSLAMKQATRECSTLLRRVRRKTWNGSGRTLTVWVSRKEYEQIEAMADDQGVKRSTVATRFLREGMKKADPKVSAPPMAPAIADHEAEVEV